MCRKAAQDLWYDIHYIKKLMILIKADYLIKNEII